MNLLLANTWLPSGAELRLFSPELALVAAIVAILLVPVLTGRRAITASLLALAGPVLGLLATAWMSGAVADGGVGGMSPDAAVPMLIADRFSVFFKLFLLVFLVCIVWLWLLGGSRSGARLRLTQPLAAVPAQSVVGEPEFFVLLLTSALGMMLMVGTLNLLVILVAIETASLPSYAIVASDRRSKAGAEAALKYVTFGAASAAIMVYGMSLLYGRFGTLDLGLIAGRAAAGAGAGAAAYDLVLWLGLAAFGAGIAFKIAAVPMHLWCPDVFEGAPVEVTTWLSVASKAAGLGLLLRVVDAFGILPSAATTGAPLAWFIGLMAAITCTVGNLAALRQESVKRILAYSSIAHAGYMMMAAAIVLVPREGGAAHPGMAAVVTYLMVYVIMNLGAFGVTAMVTWHAGTDHLSAFTGLGRRAPWLALPLAVCLFSLIGLPPLGGFAAKWFLILALGRAAEAQPWLWILVFVAAINTAISLYYYVKIIRQMYIADDAALAPLPAPLAGVALVNVCAALLLVLGTVAISPLGQKGQDLAANLFHPGAAGAHVVQR